MRPWSLLAAGTIAAAFAATAAAAPPPVTARAYILVNPQSEEILVERAADRRLPMASTTKIMTAIVTLERTKLDRQRRRSPLRGRRRRVDLGARRR